MNAALEHWQIIEELAYKQQNKPTDRDIKSVLVSADDLCLCSKLPTEVSDISRVVQPKLAVVCRADVE